MTDAIAIRPATAADLPAIAALYHAVWHETHAPAMPAAAVRHRDTGFFAARMQPLLPATLVLESAGAIAGFAAWQGALLGQIYLASAARGAGLADRLLDAAEQAIGRTGATVAELRCLCGNDRARRFYERRGWRHRADIVEWVQGDNGNEAVPFWEMTKPL